MSKKQAKSEEATEGAPTRSKFLLYFAFSMTAIGAAMLVVTTVLVFMPNFELTWDIVFKIPHTYIALGGLILVTTGLILQRRITKPMDFKETEQLRSRLE